MMLDRHKNGYSVYRLSLAMIFLVVSLSAISCSSFGRSQGKIAEVTPLPPEDSTVAYGASLSEWEEAAQGENAQTTSDSTEIKEWPFPQDGENAVDTPEPVVMYSSQESATEGSPVEDTSTEDTSPKDASTEDTTVADASEDLDASNIGEPFEFDSIVYRQILWDGLIPADFTAEAIMAKYQDELALLPDGSPQANELYSKMQEEFDNAPVNEIVSDLEVRIPGFIAPLDYSGDLITEFLLVPYFGACIHVPPPPANQTVLVTTAEGHGIKIEDSNNPIWVMGKIVTEGTTTNLAAAGYNIEEAKVEPYEVLQ